MKKLYLFSRDVLNIKDQNTEFLFRDYTNLVSIKEILDKYKEYIQIYQVLEDGKIYIGNLKEEMKIRPTLHVKPDLKIVSGSGTKDDPYKLG